MPNRHLGSLSDVIGCEVANMSRVDARPGPGPAGRQLHIWCRDDSVIDAFAAFCVLLCRRVEVDPPAKALLTCLDEFRRLLAGTSDAAGTGVMGIVGELLLLDQLLQRDRTAIRLWQGPRGGRHDFRGPGCALEVKTTLRSDAADLRVRISSIDQLDPPENGKLFLHLVRLEQADQGDLSARELQARIETKLPSGEVAALRSLVGRNELPDHPRFALLQEMTWKVDSRFPRLSVTHLLKGKLEPGVGGVSYIVDLSAASDCLVDRDSALDILVAAS